MSASSAGTAGKRVVVSAADKRHRRPRLSSRNPSFELLCGVDLLLPRQIRGRRATGWGKTTSAVTGRCVIAAGSDPRTPFDRAERQYYARAIYLRYLLRRPLLARSTMTVHIR